MKIEINIPEEAQDLVVRFYEAQRKNEKESADVYLSRLIVGQAVQWDSTEQARKLSNAMNEELGKKVQALNDSNAELMARLFPSGGGDG